MRVEGQRYVYAEPFEVGKNRYVFHCGYAAAQFIWRVGPQQKGEQTATHSSIRDRHRLAMLKQYIIAPTTYANDVLASAAKPLCVSEAGGSLRTWRKISDL